MWPPKVNNAIEQLAREWLLRIITQHIRASRCNEFQNLLQLVTTSIVLGNLLIIRRHGLVFLYLIGMTRVHCHSKNSLQGNIFLIF